MFTSGSENASWEYVPPKKLQTTLLSDSPRTLQDFENSLRFEPTQKFHAVVTPKDCTRSNSPLHMSSVLFSDYEENEEIRNMFEQLVLVRDRHATLKTYVNSIRAQLQQSFNLAIAELQGKRNILISQVDLLYDENFTKLCNSHKEKEKRIQEKDEELQNTLEEIENAIQKLERSSEFEELEQDVHKTLKMWVSENEVSGEWAEIQVPEFSYLIIPAEEFKKNSDQRKNTSRCSKHRSHRHEAGCRSSSKGKTRSFERIIKQNTEMVQRLHKLESAVTGNAKPPRPDRLQDTRFDLGMSESPISISTLYSDGSCVEDLSSRLRVYVPHGYPAYTCFYSIKVAKDILVKQVLEKLALHMGTGKSEFVLKVKEGEKMKKVDGNEKAYHLVKYKLYLERIRE